MTPLEKLTAKLHEILQNEGKEPIDVIASYIVGELIGDYDGIYAELDETNPTVQRIGDLASDLEISNGNDEELAAMWDELKKLIDTLK